MSNFLKLIHQGEHPMNQKLISISFIVMMLASVTLACSLFTGGTEQAAEEALAVEHADDAGEMEDSQEPVESGQSQNNNQAGESEEADENQTEEETSGETPTEVEPDPGVTLGDEIRSPEGGYAFQPIPEYTTESMFGMSVMEAPDADEDTGPYFMLVGGKNDEEMTNKDIYDSLNSELDIQSEQSVEILDEKEVMVNGKTGLLMDFSGMEDDQEVRARIVVVAVTPMQQFTMIAISPESDWNAVKSTFNTVLSSVTFFEPEGGDSLDFFDEDGEDDSDQNGDNGLSDAEDFFMLTSEEGMPIFIENYTVENNQSTNDEIILAFVSEDLNHILTLYLPTNLNSNMMLNLQATDATSPQAPGGTLTIGVDIYTVQSGMVIFEEVTDSYVSGSYFLEVVNAADSSDVISVTGLFKETALP
jgi:hypothetical protein